MLQLSNEVNKVIPLISYPFLIIIDPEDRAVSYEAVKQMMKISQTKEENKELLNIPKAGHGVYMHSLGKLTNKIVNWIETKLDIHNNNGYSNKNNI